MEQASTRLPADSESDSDAEEAEVDDDALRLRRQRLREKAMNKVQEEEEVLNKEDEGSEESSEEESSEYSEESDSEAEGPRMKPVFVRKKERHTIQQRETQVQTTKQVSDSNFCFLMTDWTINSKINGTPKVFIGLFRSYTRFY